MFSPKNVNVNELNFQSLGATGSGNQTLNRLRYQNKEYSRQVKGNLN